MKRVLFLLDEGAAGVPDSLLSLLPPDSFAVLAADAPSAARQRAVEEAEIIFGEPTLPELAAARSLRWVQMFWAGADRYLHGGFPRGVRLTTASGAYGETIAEHMLAMLLALCRRLPAYGRRCDWQDLGSEKRLSGGTALIFGAGDIGGSLARRLRALGVRTIGVCRETQRPREGFDALTSLSGAEVCLPQADFVLCAMPAGAATDGYFDARRIALMRDDCVFINAGRGSIIAQNRLTQALLDGKFFGVGLDVTTPEPLPTDCPLWQMDRVVLTPHVAGVSFGHLPQTEEKIWAICRENLCRYLAGEPLRNEVQVS